MYCQLPIAGCCPSRGTCDWRSPAPIAKREALRLAHHEVQLISSIACPRYRPLPIAHHPQHCALPLPPAAAAHPQNFGRAAAGGSSGCGPSPLLPAATGARLHTQPQRSHLARQGKLRQGGWDCGSLRVAVFLRSFLFLSHSLSWLPRTRRKRRDESEAEAENQPADRPRA